MADGEKVQHPAAFLVQFGEIKQALCSVLPGIRRKRIAESPFGLVKRRHLGPKLRDNSIDAMLQLRQADGSDADAADVVAAYIAVLENAARGIHRGVPSEMLADRLARAAGASREALVDASGRDEDSNERGAASTAAAAATAG